MVNHYFVSRKRRPSDAYTPGGGGSREKARSCHCGLLQSDPPGVPGCTRRNRRYRSKPAIMAIMITGVIPLNALHPSGQPSRILFLMVHGQKNPLWRLPMPEQLGDRSEGYFLLFREQFPLGQRYLVFYDGVILPSYERHEGR